MSTPREVYERRMNEIHEREVSDAKKVWERIMTTLKQPNGPIFESANRGRTEMFFHKDVREPVCEYLRKQVKQYDSSKPWTWLGPPPGKPEPDHGVTLEYTRGPNDVYEDDDSEDGMCFVHAKW